MTLIYFILKVTITTPQQQLSRFQYSLHTSYCFPPFTLFYLSLLSFAECFISFLCKMCVDANVSMEPLLSYVVVSVG